MWRRQNILTNNGEIAEPEMESLQETRRRLKAIIAVCLLEIEGSFCYGFSARRQMFRGFSELG